MSSNRCRLAARHDGAASLAIFADPSWFSLRIRGRVSLILPPTLPLTRPLSRVRGEFTGEFGGTLTGSSLSSVAGPARVRSGPGTGSAGARRRLRLWANYAFGQRFLAHSPAGSGSARPSPGGTPLAPRPPLDAADVGHSPRYAVSAVARGRQP